MYIQPKDEIKEPPASIIRISYKECDKGTTEGSYKNAEKQISSCLSSDTYSCL